MRTKQLSAHHFQLTQLGLFNAFLVQEDDGFTLIDTCLNQADQIIEAARTLGAPIRRIALTHAHNDHAGSLEKLAALLPDAEILVSRREARLLRGDRSLEAHEPQNKLRGSYITSQLTPSRLLDEGDQTGSLQVIAAPGHTPGQIAFLDRRDGMLIAGDAFSSVGGLAVCSEWKLRFPFPALATWNRDLARNSASKLAQIRPERLALGHGECLKSPSAAMAQACATAFRAVPRPAVPSYRS